MDIYRIRHRLADYAPHRIEEAGARAAVAMVLRQMRGEPEALFIRRSLREGDPWAGHVAFPGGRCEPRDPSLYDTAARETCEEVGVDVRATGRRIGALDDLNAVVRTRPVGLVISPFVCELHADVELRPDPREVDAVLWVPLPYLRSGAARSVFRRELDGAVQEYPAYRFDDFTIWGLTHRILERFFEVVDDP